MLRLIPFLNGFVLRIRTEYQALALLCVEVYQAHMIASRGGQAIDDVAAEEQAAGLLAYAPHKHKIAVGDLPKGTLTRRVCADFSDGGADFLIKQLDSSLRRKGVPVMSACVGANEIFHALACHLEHCGAPVRGIDARARTWAQRVMILEPTVIATAAQDETSHQVARVVKKAAAQAPRIPLQLVPVSPRTKQSLAQAPRVPFVDEILDQMEWTSSETKSQYRAYVIVFLRWLITHLKLSENECESVDVLEANKENLLNALRENNFKALLNKFRDYLAPKYSYSYIATCRSAVRRFREAITEAVPTRVAARKPRNKAEVVEA